MLICIDQCFSDCVLLFFVCTYVFMLVKLCSRPLIWSDCMIGGLAPRAPPLYPIDSTIEKVPNTSKKSKARVTMFIPLLSPNYSLVLTYS